MGTLQWLATQTRMDISANVGLLQSSATIAKVQDLERANAVCRRAQKHAPECGTIYFHRIPGKVLAAGWSDGSLNNRVNGGSTTGYVIGLTSNKLLHGDNRIVTPVS